MDYEMNFNFRHKAVVASKPGGIFGSISMSVLNHLQNKFLISTTLEMRNKSEIGKKPCVIHATSELYIFLVILYILIIYIYIFCDDYQKGDPKRNRSIMGKQMVGDRSIMGRGH